jgi:predicted Fe-Mo cluster-binding NifX family protein
MTKIAVSSEGPSLDDRVDPRFGRAAGFVIVDPDTREYEYLDNGASQVMAQGAGIQTAEIVGRSGATIVLTGYVGPKAFMALRAAGITVGEHLENLSVREALDRYANGEVSIAREPNKAGHWK